ncbi:MAG: hypothetical protein CMK02_15125 [Polycyclovorans sp.]|nr:hypothetical protein [Polycyclovorans sp.]
MDQPSTMLIDVVPRSIHLTLNELHDLDHTVDMTSQLKNRLPHFCEEFNPLNLIRERITLLRFCIFWYSPRNDYRVRCAIPNGNRLMKKHMMSVLLATRHIFHINAYA